MSKELRITLVKSSVGRNKDQKATLEALGLRKLGMTVTKPDNPAVRGMLTKVGHLVEIVEE
ncbi:MAG: 50S ribosomal protein L30 [Limnochordia bacterium]|jgi:large subunit ribosomal protein L30|nr:50S ribosomal protein L30 [Limnochordia bacterium]